jgi:hypothetical protein
MFRYFDRAMRKGVFGQDAFLQAIRDHAALLRMSQIIFHPLTELLLTPISDEVVTEEVCASPGGIA